jgi:hypothetical protein
MTPEQINRAVAERVMGWHRDIRPIVDENGDPLDVESWWRGHETTACRVSEWTPFSDLLQAFEVQAAMREQGYGLVLTSPWSRMPHCPWRAVFIPHHREGREHLHFTNSESESLAAAICRAALRAMGMET